MGWQRCALWGRERVAGAAAVRGRKRLTGRRRQGGCAILFNYEHTPARRQLPRDDLSARTLPAGSSSCCTLYTHNLFLRVVSVVPCRLRGRLSPKEDRLLLVFRLVHSFSIDRVIFGKSA